MSAEQSFTLTVTAAPAPETGLLACPQEGGVPVCMTRSDGGDPATNLETLTGNPKVDFLYTFQIDYNDTSGAPMPGLHLVFNGYALPMAAADAPGPAARFAYQTMLGPDPSPTYHFEARDGAGNLVARYPETGELSGPVVELLNGSNLVGLPRDLETTTLTAAETLGSPFALRWVVPARSGLAGYPYLGLVDETGPVRSGELYHVRREQVGPALPTLESVPRVAADVYAMPLAPGYNYISNPYDAPVRLADLQVRRNGGETVSWMEAARRFWVMNFVIYYCGKDWGGVYGFLNSGSTRGVLAPWLGYLLYGGSDGATYELIIPRPGG